MLPYQCIVGQMEYLGSADEQKGTNINKGTNEKFDTAIIAEMEKERYIDTSRSRKLRANQQR